MKSLLFDLAGCLWMALAAQALDPKCAPGGNFDMKPWNLQLPIGSTGNPTTISSTSLQGCSGFQNPDYFFTETSDGAMVMKVPGSPSSAGCVATSHSLHCRTELRELDPATGKPASWDPKQPVNRLSARVVALKTGDGSGTVVGQIHIDDSVSSKPVCELFLDSNGGLTMGVEQTRSGGNEVRTAVGNTTLGQPFTYEIRYEGNVLSVSVNGAAPKVLSTFSLDAPASYFKAGNYLQGTTASEIHFLELNVTHDASGAGASAAPTPGPTAPTTLATKTKSA